MTVRKCKWKCEFSKNIYLKWVEWFELLLFFFFFFVNTAIVCYDLSWELLWSEFSIILLWVQCCCDLDRHWRWSVLLGCSQPWSPLSRSSLAGECGLSWSSFLSFLVIPNLLGEWVPLNNYKHLLAKFMAIALCFVDWNDCSILP